ncbi:MBL fold metallo-hydrolase [Roseibium litorale]|uniref:MBL fold metallo-hydrolase n=1 Tax=Roseibium litorale TaxID=2803841 RepID=A0ABR9CR23_9HYPH|nr:MBL fold metallo-hydrolase [Roseibium litorale]MBD8893128.1 MBL fold metallo-hydrolase [Roseibium litorale]
MKHDRQFDPAYGEAVEIIPGLRRMTVPNPGPFTFHGTNTYLVGQGNVTVIDPGPDNPVHLDALLKATEGERIEAILVSHTHMDHSPAARTLAARTGAPVIGCAPHVAARPLAEGESNSLDASADKDHKPDRILGHGETITLSGQRFEALHTPGHTQNHLCFALPGTEFLFSADHVMVWATSIVAPPDGNMLAYMASLEVLLNRPETTYLPGHGGLVREAHAYVRDLKEHRQRREEAILGNLEQTPISVPELVLRVYKGLDPALRGAAGLSAFAHLEDLAGRGLVLAEPDLTLTALYRLA